MGEKFFKNEKNVSPSNLVRVDDILWSWTRFRARASATYQTRPFSTGTLSFSAVRAFLLRRRQRARVPGHEVLLAHRAGQNCGSVRLAAGEGVQASAGGWRNAREPKS